MIVVVCVLELVVGRWGIGLLRYDGDGADCYSSEAVVFVSVADD